jgi:hypothetical protein
MHKELKGKPKVKLIAELSPRCGHSYGCHLHVLWLVIK